MTVPRRTIKGQKVGSGPIPGNPHPFPKIAGILLPLISLWNYPPLLKLTTLYPGASLSFWDGPHSVSPWINLLSLYYGSLLNPFLCEAKNTHLAAVPGTWPRPALWPSSRAPLSFLQENLKAFWGMEGLSKRRRNLLRTVVRINQDAFQKTPGKPGTVLDQGGRRCGSHKKSGIGLSSQGTISPQRYRVCRKWLLLG